MGPVFGIICRCIATHLIKREGFSRKTAQTGAVTLIQRLGSAQTKSPGAILSSRRLAPRGEGQDARNRLNVHFHMLFLDGVYVQHPDGPLRFHWVKAPTSGELAHLGMPRMSAGNLFLNFGGRR
jgi:hypothetical protein